MGSVLGFSGGGGSKQASKKVEASEG